MNTSNLCFALLAAVFLSACSSRVTLTIDSDPPGAAVYEGGTFWGHAPVTLAYTGSSEFRDGGCMGTKSIMVKWDSGAQARVPTINLCETQDRQQGYLFTYPEGFGPLAQQGSAVQPPFKRVAPNGQLYWEVTHAPSESKLRCYSDVSGDTIKTNCS